MVNPEDRRPGSIGGSFPFSAPVEELDAPPCEDGQSRPLWSSAAGPSCGEPCKLPHRDVLVGAHPRRTRKNIVLSFSYVFLVFYCCLLFFRWIFTREGFPKIPSKYPFSPLKSYPCQFSLRRPPFRAAWSWILRSGIGDLGPKLTTNIVYFWAIILGNPIIQLKEQEKIQNDFLFF